MQKVKVELETAGNFKPMYVGSFVRSFFAGRGPAYSEPQRGDVSRSNALAQGERRGIGWCVRVCAWRAGHVG